MTKKFHVQIDSLEVSAADEADVYARLARHFGCLADGIEPDADLDGSTISVTERRTTKK